MLGYCLSNCAKTKLWHFKQGLSEVLTILTIISTIVLAYFILALIVHGISVTLYGTIMFFDPSISVTVMELVVLTLLIIFIGVAVTLAFNVLESLYIVIKKIINVILKHDEFECKWIVKCKKGGVK